MNRPRLKRVCSYLAVGLVVLALLNEAAIRVAVYFRNERSFDEFITTLPNITPWQTVTFGAIVQPSRHKKLIYELRPNMKVTHADVRVTTNSMGWRDREYAVSPAGNTLRIIGIGDSNMFGWGVDQDRNYLNVMEQELKRRYPRRRWEVINTGVPGYNTFMKVENLRARAAQFKPDLVIMHHTINDLLLPEFVYEYPDPLSLRRSYFLDFARGRYKLTDNDFKVVFEADFKEVPARFKYMEGEEGFARALVALRDLRDQHGFDVVILISHDHPVGIAYALQKYCKLMNFYCLVKMHRTDDPKLIVSAKDLHPSALGHQQIAAALIEFLREKGLLKKLLARKK